MTDDRHDGPPEGRVETAADAAPPPARSGWDVLLGVLYLAWWIGVLLAEFAPGVRATAGLVAGALIASAWGLLGVLGVRRALLPGMTAQLLLLPVLLTGLLSDSASALTVSAVVVLLVVEWWVLPSRIPGIAGSRPAWNRVAVVTLAALAVGGRVSGLVP